MLRHLYILFIFLLVVLSIFVSCFAEKIDPTKMALAETAIATLASEWAETPEATPDVSIGYKFHISGCNIIGNVSKRNDNQRIYHCPNWRDYDRIKFDYTEGDRYFCSEEEAIAAGFRKPRNVKEPCEP